MITFVLVPKPSISVNNWFKVFSRSSFDPVILLFPLALPIASISSIKIMAGDLSLACLKRSLTRDAPTPTNISTKSEPEREKKGTFASPATALARSVFPVPGCPTKRAPLGILPPRMVYFWGFLRKSTISCTSSFAPSKPATSLKVMVTSVFSSKSFAFDFPILKICPPAPPPPEPDMRRMIKIQTITITIMGRKLKIRSKNLFSIVTKS